ncbi:acetyl-CoA hydrolase/transferase C-terminal domain-containing protein [Isoalcanivorax indicus]|uniref:acetyl-CoA hydrolase/transferase C-terminal domain-containing protein n=1 Tax=Isoalcanivorax indicus TaxID=2202653 RepID=UPI001FE61E37|nr:acetyl-CoA hydrolase/transferase C-terminal domain-containing protein [Isoalcanivorax indicus]
MMRAGQPLDAVEAAVDEVIRRVGKDIRLGMPLGLGKPNQFVNALYQRACKDSSLQLTLYTALSLGRPVAGSDLEARFLKPFAERVFGDYADLDYLTDLRKNRLPANVRVCEFFFQPGSQLGNAHAQRHYISSNYTHVARDLNAAGVNVAAQLVARRDDQPGKLSLACNPEVTLDLMPLLEARRAAGEVIVAVAQVHDDLPFMGGDAVVDSSTFDLVINDASTHTRLFSTPNMPVTLQDHLVGLHASTLVRDGGLLQIGIGALGDALVHHALMREHDNARYRDVTRAFGSERFARLVEAEGGMDRFAEGLYGCSEMFTHGLMSLVDGGVIRRPVFADENLQLLLNQGALRPEASLESLDALIAAGVIDACLEDATLAWLQRFGFVPQALQLQDDALRLGSQQWANNLHDEETRKALAPHLGKPLRGGTIMHGGFFLGPAAFYERLRSLPAELAAAINMTRISFINQLYGEEDLKRLQRQDARFVNTAFTATLLGAAVSDQLDDGRVLSGVGGQYNFVCQAHELEGARSILMLRAWRERGGEAVSNIVFSYAHNTIPRHLRDIFVTEYGIADLRGKTDAEVVAAMVNISDSRFQSDLLAQAAKAGKISADYRVPEPFRYNTPEKLAEKADAFDRQKVFPLFPLGADFDDTERGLVKALAWLKEKAGSKDYLELGRRAIQQDSDDARLRPYLERMGLWKAGSVRERLQRRLVSAALSQTL